MVKETLELLLRWVLTASSSSLNEWTIVGVSFDATCSAFCVSVCVGVYAKFFGTGKLLNLERGMVAKNVLL